VWRDPIFWFAAIVSLLLVALQMAVIIGWQPDDGWWWARFLLQGGATVLIVFSIVGTGAGMARGWERGLAEAASRRRPR
jgi:uncharacterized membrane protein YeiH